MTSDRPATAGTHPFRVQAADGKLLVGDSHLPAAPRRQLLLVHGFAEHRGRYAETIAALTAAGCAVHAFDLRGHGDSGGRRGHVDEFADYRRDVAAVAADRAAALPGFAALPLVLFGHSLGGLIAADQVLHHAAPYAALALSSPFLAPAFRVPAWKEAVAALASHLPPWIPFPAGLDPAGLSHDPAVVAAYRDDPKVFDDLSASWYVAVDTAQEAVAGRAAELRLPLLVLLGGADPVADPEASRRFFAAASSEEKRLEVYDGLLHEVLNETERERVRGDLLGWLERAVPPPAG